MFTAYLDESGTDSRSPIVCVAGYGGTQDDWERFEDAWVPVLRCAGIDNFHGKESMCDPLRPLLTATIQAHKIQGLAMWVGQQDYQTIPGQRFKSTIGNAYGACAFGAALQMAAWAKENNHGPLAVVLEDGQPNVQFVRATLESMIGDDDFNIASVAVGLKKQFVPLQAADFLAHVCGTGQREWLDQLTGAGYGRALMGQLTPDMLAAFSVRADAAWKQHRHRKRQAKLAARAAARAALGTS